MFGTLLRTTLRSPEIVALLLASGGAALWAAHAGPLPGSMLVSRWPLTGSLAVLGAWLALYAGLGVVVLGNASSAERRRALRKAGYGMLLLVAGQAPLVAAAVPPLVRLRYLEPLYLLAVAMLVLGTLFRDELRAAWNRARTRPSASVFLATLVATIVAAYAVGGVDALLHVNGLWETKYQLSRAAFVANTLLLASLYVATFAVTARLIPAILLGTALFFVLGATNVAKMKYMHAAVQPLDLLSIPEFMPQFTSTFGAPLSAALIAAALLVVAAIAFTWRRAPARLAWPQRTLLAGSALLVLAGGIFSQSPGLRDALAHAGIEPIAWDSVYAARRNGVLLEFVGGIPRIVVDAPADYSEDAIERIVARRLGAGIAKSSGFAATSRVAVFEPEDAAGLEESATIVIYMIESLMDPLDLGVALTDDPLPALRRLADAHTSGRAIVPERFGGSANSEFEVLTGMSTSFLPERSVAYKQYLKRRIPSLPCLLAARGYRTVAVQADPITYFDRTKAYEHLCFERVVWLNEDPTAPRALNGRAPTDEAVVDAVLAAIHHEGPAFVFAFPSSTHHPYELDLYSESDLDLVDASHPARRELKYYVNALRVADAAVERLAAGLSAIDRRVVLAIVGDHLPPLSTEALGAFRARLENLSEDERNLVERRVPLVVWSNFARDRRELELGLNALAPYLLDLAGVEPDGFLRFVGRFGERVPVLTRDVIGIGGTPLRPASIPEEHARWIDDYRLLQHDALFGASYLSRLLETSDIVKAAMPLE